MVLGCVIYNMTETTSTKQNTVTVIDQSGAMHIHNSDGVHKSLILMIVS